MIHFRHLITLLVLPGLLAACIAAQPDRLATNTSPDDESGVGGTGIIGAITGFGSIFVNGVEVEIDRHTQLSVDGRPVDDYTFTRGDVVEILATGSGLMHARRLAVRHEVIGAVEQVDVSTGQFGVLGQTILRPESSGRLPRIGERVKVSGFRDSAGRIYATRVAPAGKASALITGELRRTDSGELRIGDQRIALRGDGTIRAGTFVRVTGRIRNGVLETMHATSLDTAPFGAAVRRLLVQGFVHKVPGQHYRIDRIPFTPAGEGTGMALPAGQGRPLRLELLRGANNRLWTAARFISDSGLPMGTPAPAPHNTPRWRSPGMSPMPAGGMPGMGGMGGRHGR